MEFTDLKQEREQLEQKVKQLSSSISVSQPHAFSDRYRDAELACVAEDVWLSRVDAFLAY